MRGDGGLWPLRTKDSARPSDCWKLSRKKPKRLPCGTMVCFAVVKLDGQDKAYTVNSIPGDCFTSIALRSTSCQIAASQSHRKVLIVLYLSSCLPDPLLHTSKDGGKSASTHHVFLNNSSQSYLNPQNEYYSCASIDRFPIMDTEPISRNDACIQLCKYTSLHTHLLKDTLFILENVEVSGSAG